jgi:hypothetical protein
MLHYKNHLQRAEFVYTILYIQSPLGKGRFVDKEPKWNALKSERLKKVRGVSFEDILKTKFIKLGDHHNRDDQRLMFFEYRKQVWVVPFVENEKERFLKTLYPSRKHTKLYEKGEL